MGKVYVASMLKVMPHLVHPGSRVLVAVNHPAYASRLLSAIRDRSSEAGGLFAGAIINTATRTVHMPNNVVLYIQDFENLDMAHYSGGMQFTYMFHSYKLAEDVCEYLSSLVRAGRDFTGTVGSEVFEELRDIPMFTKGVE